MCTIIIVYQFAVCVSCMPLLSFFSLFTALFLSFLFQEIRDHRVADVKFFHTVEGFAGFAIMTFNYHFYVVADSDRDKDEIRVKVLAELPCKQLLRLLFLFMPIVRCVKLVLSYIILHVHACVTVYISSTSVFSYSGLRLNYQSLLNDYGNYFELF